MRENIYVLLLNLSVIPQDLWFESSSNQYRHEGHEVAILEGCIDSIKGVDVPTVDKDHQS